MWRMRNSCALAALAAIMVPVAAIAQTPAPAEQKEHHVTLYAGYRAGGKLTDVNTAQTWEMTDGAAYALSAGIGLTRTTQFELFVSHRQSALKAGGFSPAAWAPRTSNPRTRVSTRRRASRSALRAATWFLSAGILA
jgi:hypothetical protein